MLAMTLIFRAASISDLGLRRANNEDVGYASGRLLVVADGMGGLPAGEVASGIVVRALVAMEDKPGNDEPLTLLREALESANQEIRAAVDVDPARDGMGTTVTALLLVSDGIAMVHAGDSRCYRMRDGRLRQLTRDDTLVQALVEEGVLTPAEAREHPKRSVVTQALQGRSVTVTGAMLVARRDDRYLLCSDGLSDVVDDESLLRTMRTIPEPHGCAEHLVKLAVQAGAPDNVTVIIADVKGPHQM
jgi:PPM family protein phosphatase